MATPALAGGAREDQTKRIAPAQQQTDLDAYTALQGITTYAPANTAYAKIAVTAKYTALKAAQDAELAAQVALATARDAATAARGATRRVGLPQQHAGGQGAGHRSIRQELRPGAGIGLEEEVRIQSAYSQGKSRLTR